MLTNYNGTNISYDEIGNPLNWRNLTSMTWTQGRRLTAYTYVKNGKTYNITLTYNADGIRIGKLIQNANDASDITVRGYVLDGTALPKETVALEISKAIFSGMQEKRASSEAFYLTKDGKNYMY